MASISTVKAPVAQGFRVIEFCWRYTEHPIDKLPTELILAKATAEFSKQLAAIWGDYSIGSKMWR